MFPRLLCVMLLVSVASGVILAGRPCLAYVDRVQMPLSGLGAYALARGTATFTEGFGQDADAGAVLTVDVTNVPLPAGTELVVIVDEREVGTVTLDRQRRARFQLDSRTARKTVPRLKTSSRVILKLAGGPTVMW